MTGNEDIPADIASLIRIGTVLSVDLAQARCVVRYGDPDDEDGGDAQTPPIRWLTPRAGQTRIWSPPSVGEQVVLLAPDGQIGAAVAIAGIWQDDFPPPNDSETETIQWKDGAAITYDPVAHDLLAVLPGGGTATITAPGGITLRGDVTIEGNLEIEGGAEVRDDVIVQGDVEADGISLKDHVHNGVQAGMAQSGPPA